MAQALGSLTQLTMADPDRVLTPERGLAQPWLSSLT